MKSVARSIFAYAEALYRRESFIPTYLIGAFINPVYIIRRNLFLAVKKLSGSCNRSKVLDFGCGRKPYARLFSGSFYVGVDVPQTGHDHESSSIDVFFDGTTLPFHDEYFDTVVAFEVFEHVYDLRLTFHELSRVLEPGGSLLFTCPFAWEEHEIPFDYARRTRFFFNKILPEHGFEIVTMEHSPSTVLTLGQIFANYIHRHVLPNHSIIKVLLTPFCIAPISFISMFLDLLFPPANNFYLSTICLAKKAV